MMSCKKNALSFYRLMNKFVLIKNMESNKRILKEISNVSSIDPVSDIHGFKQYVNCFKAESGQSKLFEFHSLCKEAFLYGHIQSLCEYAEIPFEWNKLYPNVEHGVNFSEATVVDSNIFAVPRRIYQGLYKIQNGQLTNDVAIGPYIRYVHEDDNSYRALVRKECKTLLIFPSHSFENSEIHVTEREYVNKIMRLGKKYDRVIVCAYWNNINDSLYDLFTSNGITVVSAGMRFDPAFIKRLKSIILCADCILGDDIGTYVGYGYALNKKISLFISDLVIKEAGNVNQDKTGTHAEQLKRAIIESDHNSFEKWVDYYWGTSIKKVSIEEMRSILSWRE